MIDIHCHLEYMENPVDVIEEARNKMTAIVTSVADPEYAEKILKLMEKYANFLFVSLGFHPHCTNDYTMKQVDEYIDFIRKRRNDIVAIGETGLDYSYESRNIDRKRMKEIFYKFIDLANELNLPLVVHARDAFDDVLNILNEKDTKNIVLHCFSGSEGNLRSALSKGYYISYATNIVKTKKHPRLAEKTPLDRMMLETDAPWLDPEASGTLTNKPWKILHSAKIIAEIKGISVEEVLQVTTKNAKEFFGL